MNMNNWLMAVLNYVKISQKAAIPKMPPSLGLISMVMLFIKFLCQFS